MKSFFAIGRDSYDPARGAAEPYYLNNFGYYRDIDADISVNRPRGRSDWQLIYVSSGELTLPHETVGAGECYLFAPGEAQVYTYRAGHNTLFYWVHFTGGEIPMLLEMRGFTPGKHGARGRTQEAESLFRLFCDALLQKGESNPYTCALLQALLCLFSEMPLPRTPFRRAKERLEEVGGTVTVDELAALYHMTPAHFIRSFKEAYGTTPADYCIRYRISKAKSLLVGTALSVGGIAELCGFSDALYFSRLFKKKVGMTPTEYRSREFI